MSLDAFWVNNCGQGLLRGRLEFEETARIPVKPPGDGERRRLV